MSCVQITGCKLASSSYTFPRDFQASGASTYKAAFPGTKLPKISLKSKSTYSYRRLGPVCLFGGKGKSETGNEASPWKAIEKVTGIFKKNSSIEDVLKQQIQRKEYYDDGGSGGEGPPDGGGGGGGFGGASDENPLEEFGQKTLAILALLFLYLYIIDGATISALAKDTLKFLFKRQQSIRLKRFINKCKKFLDSMKQEEEYYDPLWLQRAIINTPTMYDSPRKIKKIIEMATAPDSSSSPPENVDSGFPEYGDDSPPQYIESSAPDDDDQYSW